MSKAVNMGPFDAHPDYEFRNLTRSTLPLLAYWRNEATVLSTIGTALGIGDLVNARVSFEYATASADPRDKASYTDVMVESPSTAIAIEGKWTEPRYETVSEWRRKGSESNREKVLSHWLRLIRQKAPTLDEGGVAQTVYQMVHRTASACAIADKRSVVIYQIFLDGSHQVDYAGDLRALVSTLGVTGIQFWLQEIPIATTEEYRRLKLQIAQMRLEDIPAVVRQALGEHELFQFEAPHFRLMLSEPART
jgi:hypothetical protein